MDSTSSLCPTIGRPDMYGLGIRIAFYIQWLAAVIIEYFDEEDLPDLRFLGAFLSAAATTSLVVQISRDDLEPMDIYMTLLLGIGVFFFAMPLHVWRAVTRCNPNLDPFQLSQEQHGFIFQFSTFLLLATNASVGTWYYTSYLPNLNRSCRQYAFVFGKTDLEDKRTHIRLLHEARTLSGLAVFGVLVAAIELSIKWNKIKGISDFTTVAQLLPFFLSAGIVLRVMFQHQVRKQANAASETSSDSRRIRRGMEDVEIIGEPWPHVPPQTYRPG
ncbi:hypothetical protein B0J13DRAFT_456637 [Dactylonectria estremocensis]|uniref:Uncharacterized protein n=1 Tax=Dactylonectria estremocensis TaxID=1079267 RepID=A0A9P9DMS4_9HYPO|nr:hypothetical protein B0J13DRAFT_456637 [Dactylonectria estremocensis]